MKRKRKHEDFELKNNNNFIYQKEINFLISNKNKIIENSKQQNESKNVRDASQSYSINYESKKPFYESPDKSNSKENVKMLNIFDDIENNLINYYGLNNSNKIKVIKNKKVVYINSCFLNSYSTIKDIEKRKKTNFIVKNKRSSKYRGVSQNGNKWQVLIMIKNKKYYIGSFLTEELAARIYDIIAIKNWGVKARTNFIYNNIQIKKIFENQINIKSDNISEIIKELIN